MTPQIGLFLADQMAKLHFQLTQPITQQGINPPVMGTVSLTQPANPRHELLLT